MSIQSTVFWSRYRLIPCIVGKVKTKDHKRWIDKQIPRENILQTQRSFHGVDFPGDKDVLLGWGWAICNHKGNVLLRSVLAESSQLFDSGKYGEKPHIVTLLITIKKQCGKFLKRQPDWWWIEAEGALAEDKVSHAFRSVRVKLKTHSNTTRGVVKN